MRKGIVVALALCAALVLAPVALAGEGGSWGQISTDLSRPEGWQQFVQDSEFALGEATEIGKSGDITLYERGFGSYPSIDGSTVCVPMALEFGRQHLGLSEADLQGFVFFSTTHGAYEHLIGRQPNGSAMLPEQNTAMDAAHPVDLVIATEPSDEELAMAADAGIALVKEPLCYDAFVFITHKDNPVDSLTVAQIRGIYGGEIDNWSQVGGEDEEIWAFQREKNSGSQTAMENLVMQGAPMTGADRNYLSEFMSALIERIGDYHNGKTSLGYTYLYYLERLYPEENIKVLAVDGVYPTPEAVRDGSYPFSTHYYGVIRGDEEDAVGGQFLSWMLSEDGQRSIAQAGYIPMQPVEEVAVP